MARVPQMHARPLATKWVPVRTVPPPPAPQERLPPSTSVGLVDPVVLPAVIVVPTTIVQPRGSHYVSFALVQAPPTALAGFNAFSSREAVMSFLVSYGVGSLSPEYPPLS